MAYNNNKIKIPQCFEDKIAIDKELKELRKEKVLDFATVSKAIYMQRTYRLRCQKHIKTQSGNTGNGNLA